MKKKTILIIVVVVLALGAIFSALEPKEEAVEQAEPEVDITALIKEHFQENNLIDVDHITKGQDIEVALSLDTDDKDAAEAAISLYSNSLAKKLSAHDVTSLSLLWALPSLSNVCEAKYEKQGEELVQTSFKYDV